MTLPRAHSSLITTSEPSQNRSHAQSYSMEEKLALKVPRCPRNYFSLARQTLDRHFLSITERIRSRADTCFRDSRQTHALDSRTRLCVEVKVQVAFFSSK